MSDAAGPTGGSSAPSGLYGAVVGQERAVGQLRAAAARPVHAYLLEGPPGSGKRAAAEAFAAALLCDREGCGECRSCRLVLWGRHPDLRVVEPEGSFLMVKQADEIVARAALSPAEGRRNVLLLDDFHLVHPQAAPKLLKMVEEPPERTVFLILTERVPPELVTIASRCVRIELSALTGDAITRVLVHEGVEGGTARQAAEMAGGRLDRARLLASDPGVSDRRDLWRSLPRRLDGTGAAVVTAAAEIDAAINGAAAALSARHAAERESVEERAKRAGERGAGRARMTDRHKRELRRLRTDELRFGLVTLGAVYRESAAASDPDAFVRAGEVLRRAAEALPRNPNEALLLQSVLLSLPGLDPSGTSD